MTPINAFHPVTGCQCDHWTGDCGDGNLQSPPCAVWNSQSKESRVKKDEMCVRKQVDPEARFSPCWLRRLTLFSLKAI